MITKEDVHEAIDRLNEDQLSPVATLLEELLSPSVDPVLERLKGIPGIWPPRFEKVERLGINGDLASERLIRESCERSHTPAPGTPPRRRRTRRSLLKYAANV